MSNIGQTMARMKGHYGRRGGSRRDRNIALLLASLHGISNAGASAFRAMYYYQEQERKEKERRDQKLTLAAIDKITKGTRGIDPEKLLKMSSNAVVGQFLTPDELASVPGMETQAARAVDYETHRLREEDTHEQRMALMGLQVTKSTLDRDTSQHDTDRRNAQQLAYRQFHTAWGELTVGERDDIMRSEDLQLRFAQDVAAQPGNEELNRFPQDMRGIVKGLSKERDTQQTRERETEAFHQGFYARDLDIAAKETQAETSGLDREERDALRKVSREIQLMVNKMSGKDLDRLMRGGEFDLQPGQAVAAHFNQAGNEDIAPYVREGTRELTAMLSSRATRQNQLAQASQALLSMGVVDLAGVPDALKRLTEQHSHDQGIARNAEERAQAEIKNMSGFMTLWNNAMSAAKPEIDAAAPGDRFGLMLNQWTQFGSKPGGAAFQTKKINASVPVFCDWVHDKTEGAIVDLDPQKIVDWVAESPGVRGGVLAFFNKDGEIDLKSLNEKVQLQLVEAVARHAGLMVDNKIQEPSDAYHTSVNILSSLAGEQKEGESPFSAEQRKQNEIYKIVKSLLGRSKHYLYRKRAQGMQAELRVAKDARYRSGARISGAPPPAGWEPDDWTGMGYRSGQHVYIPRQFTPGMRKTAQNEAAFEQNRELRLVMQALDKAIREREEETARKERARAGGR